LNEKKVVELWSTNEKVIGANVDPPKLNFSTDYISARRVCWPLKFLHALEIEQGLLTHPRAASRWALPHISSYFSTVGNVLMEELYKMHPNVTDSDFYPRDAMLGWVFAIATCLDVRLSVRHTPVLCLAERKQDREMYTI